MTKAVATTTHSEQDIIRGAEVVSPAYMHVHDGCLVFNEEAFVGGSRLTAQQQESKMSLHLGEKQVYDLVKKEDETEELPSRWLRPVNLYYDDGSCTHTIPIANVVIQFSTEDIATMTANKELCVGLPLRVFDTLSNMLAKAFPPRGASFVGRTLQEGWIDKIGDLYELLSVLKSNVLADIYAEVYVERFVVKSPNKGPRAEDDERWMLGMTVGFVDAISTTEIGCAKGIVGRRKEASDELVQAAKTVKEKVVKDVKSESGGYAAECDSWST